MVMKIISCTFYIRSYTTASYYYYSRVAVDLISTPTLVLL